MNAVKEKMTEVLRSVEPPNASSAKKMVKSTKKMGVYMDGGKRMGVNKDVKKRMGVF